MLESMVANGANGQWSKANACCQPVMADTLSALRHDLADGWMPPLGVLRGTVELTPVSCLSGLTLRLNSVHTAVSSQLSGSLH